MAGLIDVGLIKPELAGAFAAGYRGADIARQQAQQAEQQLARGRQQMELDQMTIDRLKEDRKVMLDFQEKLKSIGQDPDLDKLFDAMIATGRPDYMTQGLEGKKRYQDQKEFARIMGFDMPAAAPAAAPMVAPMGAAPVNALAPEATAAPAPVNALMAAAPSAAPVPVANAMAIAANVEGTRRKINQLIALGTPQALAAAKVLETDIAAMQRQHAVAPGGTLVGPQGEVLFKAPEKEPTSTAITEYNFAKTPQGGNFKGSFQDFLLARAIASRPPGPPKEPSKAVEVVDPNDPSKIIFVSAEEAIRRNLTPARAQEGLTVKERQRRDASYPQATSAVKGFETKSEQFIKDLERLRDDPGLNQITGPVYGRTPSVSAAGSRAQALYDKIFAKGGFQALQDMREASKTGGALGNVSNEEGRRLEKSVVGGLDRKQNINDVKQGINDLIAEIRTSQARVRDAYDMTYEYRQGAGGAPSPATAPAAAPASATAFPTPPAAAVDALKRGVGTDAQFDAIFGPGAAARARGR